MFRVTLRDPMGSTLASGTGEHAATVLAAMEATVVTMLPEYWHDRVLYTDLYINDDSYIHMIFVHESYRTYTVEVTHYE